MDQRIKKGRRYSAEERTAAVRIVRTLRAELGTSQGTVVRVADQLGYGSSRYVLGCGKQTLMTA